MSEVAILESDSCTQTCHNMQRTLKDLKKWNPQNMDPLLQRGTQKIIRGFHALYPLEVPGQNLGVQVYKWHQLCAPKSLNSASCRRGLGFTWRVMGT